MAYPFWVIFIASLAIAFFFYEKYKEKKVYYGGLSMDEESIEEQKKQDKIDKERYKTLMYVCLVIAVIAFIVAIAINSQ